jgi:hypothetical protein
VMTASGMSNPPAIPPTVIRTHADVILQTRVITRNQTGKEPKKNQLKNKSISKADQFKNKQEISRKASLARQSATMQNAEQRKERRRLWRFLTPQTGIVSITEAQASACERANNHYTNAVVN